MSSSPGITIDRGIKILRLSLWAGGGLNLLLAAALVLAPELVLPARATPPPPFYSAVLAVTLAALGAIGLVAAYAPYGNRKLMRLLALTGLALGGVGLGAACGCYRGAWPLLSFFLSIHLILALALLIGLRMARL